MIYLDNAATTFPKPAQVYRAASGVMERLGANPGRSGHRMSLAAGRVAFQFLLPYDRGGCLAQLYDSARVDAVDYQLDGIAVSGSCDPRLYGQICKLLGVDP